MVAYLALSPFYRGLNALMARCRHLLEIAGDPYRPERHYMRGPGPKWRAKHHGGTEIRL